MFVSAQTGQNATPMKRTPKKRNSIGHAWVTEALRRVKTN